MAASSSFKVNALHGAGDDNNNDDNGLGAAASIENNLITELQELDLTLNEARILVFLMSHGQSQASDISRQTGIQRTETYNYVASLLAKGIVFATIDRPQKYYSAPLEEVVDTLVQAKKNALEVFENKKKYYVSMLEALIGNKVVRQEDKERYNFVMGENAITAKIGRMLADAKEEVAVLVTEKNLINFYHGGIIDQFIQLTTKGILARIKASHKNAGDYIATAADGGSSNGRAVEVDTVQNAVPASFILVDNTDLMVLLESQSSKKADLRGFYTNNQSLVSVFRFLFDSAA